VAGALEFAIALSLVDRVTGPLRGVASSLGKVRQAASAFQQGDLFSDIRRNGLLDPSRWDAWGVQMREHGMRFMKAGAWVSASAMAMRGGIRGLSEPFVEFEHALSAVRTVAPGTFGDVRKDLEQVKRAALAWSQTHTDSASAFTRASYMMISAGLDTRQAIAGTQTALAVAKATMGDASVAASLLGSMYINLGDRSADVAREMARLGDVVTRTQQYFKIADLGQLNEGLKYAVPVAKQYGISLEQLSMAVGTLNTAGLEGSMAGTAFSAAMRQMIQASEELGFGLSRGADGGLDFLRTIENIRAKYGDFATMTDETRKRFQKAFGDEGLRAISIFMGASTDMRRAFREIVAATGATARAQKIMEEDGLGAWQKFQRSLEAVKIALGESLAPTLTDLAAGLRAAAIGLKGFVEAHPMAVAWFGKAAIGIAAFLTVLGPPALALGLLATGIGSLLSVLSRLGAVAVRLGPVLARYGLVAARAILELGRGVVFLGRMLGTVLWSALLRVLPLVWAFTVALLANPITWIVLGVVALIGAIVALIVYWDKVSAAIRTAAGWLVQAFAAAWKWIKEGFAGAIAWLQEHALRIGIILLGPMAWVVAGIQYLWSGAINALVEKVTGFGRKFWEAGKALFGAMWEGMKSIAGSVVGWFEETLGSIRAFLPFSDAKEGPLSDLTRSGRALVQTWAGGMTDAMPVLAGAAERMAGQVRGALDGVMGFETPSIQVEALSAGRQGTGSQPSRGVTIQHLIVQVQARDFREQDQFVGLLTSLADQYG